MFDSLSIYFGKNVKQLKSAVPMKINKKICDLIMVLQKQNKRLWNQKSLQINTKNGLFSGKMYKNMSY